MTAKRAYKQFHIGFSKEEWEIVCRKAKAARLRNGTYVRRMAVKGEIKYYELKELVTLKRAFLSIGNNLNQIAKVANESGSVYQKDIEDLQEEDMFKAETEQQNVKAAQSSLLKRERTEKVTALLQFRKIQWLHSLSPLIPLTAREKNPVPLWQAITSTAKLP